MAINTQLPPPITPYNLSAEYINSVAMAYGVSPESLTGESEQLPNLTGDLIVDRQTRKLYLRVQDGNKGRLIEIVGTKVMNMEINSPIGTQMIIRSSSQWLSNITLDTASVESLLLRKGEQIPFAIWTE